MRLDGIVWSAETKRLNHLGIVYLANMSHIYGDDALADKIMWDTREERSKDLPPIKPMIFNHEAYHEHYRNELAISAGKAYENDTIRKIWHEQTALTHNYRLYQEGMRSEQDFKDYCKRAYSTVQILLEQERKLIAA